MKKENKMIDQFAKEIGNRLQERNEKLVFAESCTAGLLSSTLGQIPGISAYLCGSAVTYRPNLKMKWLGVKLKTINKFTTESKEVAAQMALGVLKKASEADWSIAVVGHMGPDAPENKDGVIYICFARRTKKGRIKIKDTVEYKCKSGTRILRLKEATEVVFTHFVRLLDTKNRQEEATEAEVV